jgi:hypothetical protein
VAGHFRSLNDCGEGQGAIKHNAFLLSGQRPKISTDFFALAENKSLLPLA